MARDLEISAWLDRLAGASLDQIRRRFGLGRSQAYHRLQVLQRCGLVRRRHVLAGCPTAYTSTGRALRPSGYHHALALSELVVAVEVDGREILSEIELRRERVGQGSLDARLSAVQRATVAGCPRLPDAVEVHAQGTLGAYEVELSSKGRARRSRILAAYAASEYSRVEWICPDPQLRALLAAEVTEHGLSAFVEVSPSAV